MDILKAIEKQIESIKAEDNSTYLDQIFSHLDRAELYYKNGQTDEQYFNDVIYRSNQAYEGALKEAYKVLAGKTEDELNKTTPYKIEAHLKDNNIFRERVLQLFENYRQEWRNKSTHDYKLVFKEDEAFIALMSVTSFVHLLLKEILEKTAFNKEISKQKPKTGKTKKSLAKEGGTLADKLTKLLLEFTKNTISTDTNTQMFEVEILGKLHGFLSLSDDNLKIFREARLSSDKNPYLADFLIEDKNEKVVIEVKRNSNNNKIQLGVLQVLTYLRAADVKEGILYFVSTIGEKTTPKVEKHLLNMDGKDYYVHVITT